MKKINFINIKWLFATIIVSVASVSTFAQIDHTNSSELSSVTARGEINAGEGVSKSYDNNTNSKWLDVVNNTYINFAFNSAILANGISFTSANDAPERDPKNFTISGSNNGVNYTELATFSNQSFGGRFEKKVFQFFSNTTSYTNIRIDIQSDNTSGNTLMQVAEIEIFEYTPPTTITGFTISGANTITNTLGAVQLTSTITPSSEVATSTFLWTSLNPQVASVNNSGLVNAVGNGVATIVGMVYNSLSTLTGNFLITVSNQDLPTGTLIYEPFSYAEANFNLPSLNGGYGLTSNWTLGENGSGTGNSSRFRIKNSPEFAPTQLRTSGGYVTGGAFDNNGQSVNRPINVNMPGMAPFTISGSNKIGNPGTVLYASFFIAKMAEYTDHEITLSLFDGTNPNSNAAGRMVEIGYFNNTKTGNDYPFAIRSGSSTTSDGATINTLQGSKNFVVLKMEFGATEHTFTGFLNPDLSVSSEPSTGILGPTKLTHNTNNNGFSRVGFQIGNDENGSGPGNSFGSGVFDEFRLGTSWSTVTPVILPSGITIAGNGSIDTFGGTAQFTESVVPAEAVNKTVTWSVSPSNIASISGTGLLQALGNGIVTVSGTTVNSLTGIAIVSISGQSPTSITINSLNGFTTDGYNLTLTGLVVPSEAASGIIFSSLNTTVATINEVTGELIPQSDGIATIVGISTVNSSVKGYAIISIPRIKAQKVILMGNNINIFNGITTITSTVLPNNATDKSINYFVIGSGVTIDPISGVLTADGSLNGIVTVVGTSNVNSSAIGMIIVTISGQSPQYLLLNADFLSTTGFDFDAQVVPSNAANEVIWSATSGGTINSLTGEYLANTLGVTVTITAISNVNANVIATAIVFNTPRLLVGEATITGLSQLETGVKYIYDYEYAPFDASFPIFATWSSSDQSIFTVNNGSVTGVGNGTATLNLRLSNAFSTITGMKTLTFITRLSDYIINTNKSILLPNETSTISGVVSPLSGSLISEGFISSNSSIASVDENGVLRALTSGIVTISGFAVSPVNTVMSSNLLVFTVVSPISSVSIIGNPNIAVGFKVKYTATFAPNNATGPITYVWKSSNENVATVDNGTVTGIGGGSVTITAIAMSPFSTVSGIRIVNVNAPQVAMTSATIVGSNAAVLGSSNVTLTAMYMPANASGSKTYSWSSSNTSVATITQNGEVIALAEGNTTITVTITSNVNQVTYTYDLAVILSSIKNVENIVSEVYPNPVSQLLSVNLKEAASLKVVNNLGETVLQDSLIKGNNFINVSTLYIGIYTFHIFNEKTLNIIKVVVK